MIIITIKDKTRTREFISEGSQRYSVTKLCRVLEDAMLGTTRDIAKEFQNLILDTKSGMTETVWEVEGARITIVIDRKPSFECRNYADRDVSVVGTQTRIHLCPDCHRVVDKWYKVESKKFLALGNYRYICNNCAEDVFGKKNLELKELYGLPNEIKELF